MVLGITPNTKFVYSLKYIIFKVENMRAECTREDMCEYKRSKTNGSGII